MSEHYSLFPYFCSSDQSLLSFLNFQFLNILVCFLYFLGEKSGAIALALPGLTAGRQSVRRNSAKFKNF